MTVDMAGPAVIPAVIPAACTVDDVWRVRGDWRGLRAAAKRLRSGAAGPDSSAVVAALVDAAAALRHGQELLSAVLERVEVPMTWHPGGRLTFFPHDAADLAAIRAAQATARDIHARLEAALARHRATLSPR